jgi:light-regulated signal transduction histidine kinase (bacteriophytochrome)
VLAAVQNSHVVGHALKVEQPVVFGGRKLLVLRAVSDISAREENVSTIARNAAMIAAALVMLLGWILWNALQRTAIRPLEAEIHEHAKKERELRQRTVELETAIKELDSFSYSVSHDLRGPLRAIDGYCHILNQDYADVLDAGAQQYLARTRAAAQRMGQLTDDLLGLSRMARHALNMTEVDLSALARETVDRLSQNEPLRQVDISIADGLGAHADSSLMSVVLDNLIGNAWKYTAQTAGAAIEFGRQERDGATVFFVRDNGTGFDMQFAHKLFLPFQRLHGTDFQGNGIGLAMVQRIIQRHGGRIWAEAKPGKGAIFYFTLP